MKPKIAYTSTATFVMAMLMFVVVAPVMQNAAATSTTQSIDCASRFTPSEYQTIQSMDKTKARSLSDSNNQLQSMIKGHNSEYSSIFTEWSWNPTDCSDLTLNNVNIVYTLNDNNGKYLRHVIVTLDPSLDKVLNVAEQNANVTHTAPTTNWSAYELAGDSSASTEIQEATDSWTMPTVSSPSGKNCATNVCSAAFWVGIEKGTGGVKMVQAGTDQNVTCTGCGSNDYVWYEAINDKTVYCTGYSYHHGNSVFSDITNEDRTSMANQGKYDFTIADNTQGVQCTGTIDYSGTMLTGNYGIFAVERPTYSTGMAYLTQFTNNTSMGTGWMYYSSASHKITTSGVISVNDVMKNPYPSFTNLNADTSSISNGAFNQNYHNSNGE
ncbi:MAG: G1 family glutamic endopeptidase [Nitrosotalea sp.]